MMSTNVWERRVSLFKKHCLGFFGGGHETESLCILGCLGTYM